MMEIIKSECSYTCIGCLQNKRASSFPENIETLPRSKRRCNLCCAAVGKTFLRNKNNRPKMLKKKQLAAQPANHHDE